MANQIPPIGFAVHYSSETSIGRTGVVYNRRSQTTLPCSITCLPPETLPKNLPPNIFKEKLSQIALSQMPTPNAYRAEDIIRVYMIPWLDVNEQSLFRQTETMKVDNSGADAITDLSSGDKSPIHGWLWRRYGLSKEEGEGLSPVTLSRSNGQPCK